jgi:preprotein translocase subunit SecE
MGPQPPRPVAHGGDEPRRNPFRFIRESWAELRKVEWPSQKQVTQGTVVVLILCIVVGIFLWLSDLAFKHLVQDLFLK